MANNIGALRVPRSLPLDLQYSKVEVHTQNNVEHWSGPETCSQQKRGKRLGIGPLRVGRLGIRWLSQGLNKIRQLDFELGIWPNDLKRFVYLL